jgi:gliding motility-associated-like protein
MKRQLIAFFIFLSLISIRTHAQGPDCTSADPFCTGTTATFPASTTTTAPVGPNYGCLGSEPNPAWYFLQIDTPGTIIIDMYNSASVDIDFCCWGPFSSAAAGCASGLSGSPVDCSYSAAATETCTITATTPGEVYILMITNFSGMPTNISFADNPSSTGTTDCTILCAITGLTATPGACTTATGTYDLTGTITFSDPPSSGTLVVTNSCSGATQSFTAPFTSPYSYTLTGLPANGLGCTVSAVFSADTSCNFTQSFTAPPPCAVYCQISSVTATPTACDPVTLTYDLSGNVTFSNAPSTGTLTIINSCGGPPVVLNPPFTSPAAYGFTGLTADGASCTITAVFSDSSACTLTQTYTAPVSCSACPVVASNDGPMCAGGTLNLTASPTVAGALYSWAGPGGFSSSLQNPSISPVTAATAGTYSVTITIPSPPCTSSAATTFVVDPNPSIGTSGNATLYAGESATIFATGGNTYVWSPSAELSCSNCDTAIATPSETTTYTVVVTNSSGCVDSAELTVYIVPPCPTNRTMTMPNAFSPNRDNVNDELCLAGWDDCVENFMIMIYDRWGEKVYESSDPKFCWNGFYKGKLLDPGVYVYFIKASYMTDGATPTDKKQVDVSKNGNISLLR